MSDVSAVITGLLPALNAASTADLVYWTQDELYQWADEAVKRLARRAAVFVNYSAAMWSAAEVPLIPNAIAPALIAWNGSLLRVATVAELEALDDNWEAATGTPKRWTLDLGLQQVRLYPAPDVAGMVQGVIIIAPADLSATQTALEAVAPISGFLAQSVLGQARGRVSDAEMPEVAAHCAQRAAMYLEIFARYWGAS